MYNYFCYGAGSSLVEVDCLTGDHHILRSHHTHLFYPDFAKILCIIWTLCCKCIA